MRLFPRLRSVLLGLLALAPALAHAEDGGLRDLCAERPGKATPSCIVDKGRLLVELDAFDLTYDREGGTIQQTVVAFAPHLRLGLTDTVEAGVAFIPWTQLRTRDGSDAPTKIGGIGDTVVNLKISLKNPDGQGPSVAVLPYISAPTARRGLGAGGVQGGVIVPIALSLPSGIGLGLDPEVDALRTDAGGERPAYAIAAVLSHALAGGFTGGVEMWSSATRTPQGWDRLATADATLAWIPARRPDLQLDAGLHLGLTRLTPGVEAYVGISRRF